MRITHVTLVAVLGLLFAPAPAAAQFCLGIDEQEEPDPNSVAACAAATITPFGALPTLLPSNVLGRATTGIGFNFRLGSMDEEGDTGRRNFGIGVDIPMGKASIGLTGGYADFTCDDDDPDADVECQNAIMFGGHFVTPLVTNPIGAAESGQSFVLGLNASVGYGTGDVLDVSFGGETLQFSASGLSVGVGVPIALVARTGSVRITPFLEPSFFWGRSNLELSGSLGAGDETETGTGFALGGGVSFGFASGFAFDVGFKKVMLDEAKALIGLGLSYQR
jgi:opacity protein-like surface antigen